MGRVFRSLLTVGFLALIAVSFGDPSRQNGPPTFGRFGYNGKPVVPGWEIDAHGFRPRHPMSDLVQFPGPTSALTATVFDAATEELDLGVGPEGSPSKLRLDLNVPGFSMQFKNGIDLRVTATSAPFLSWPEGSVAQTVPTPAVPWVLVSYRTDQPPILFSFQGDPQAMVVTGSAGDWHIRTAAPFQGWVRVLLPIGLASASPTNASGLGELCARVSLNADMWTGPSPQLQSLTFETDATGLVASWNYDKPGALVPSAFALASYGGYPVRILSDVLKQDGAPDEGPITLSREAKLSIRFPLRPVPPWRYLSIGNADNLVGLPEMTTPQAADLAFAVLAGDADRHLATYAGQALMRFLSVPANGLEPSSGLKLPYGNDGNLFDLTAAHALLTQAVASANGSPDLPNPLLNDVMARVDPYTCRPWGVDEPTARRASALASVALAMRSAPGDRLKAAMLQAGASAQRGFDIWLRRNGPGSPEATRHLEVLEGLRQLLFSVQASSPAQSNWEALFSPLRSYVSYPISLRRSDGKLMLHWTSLAAGPNEIGLYSPESLKIGASQNLAEVTSSYQVGALVIRFKPKDVGECALELVLPADFPPLPASASLKYDESLH